MRSKRPVRARSAALTALLAATAMVTALAPDAAAAASALPLPLPAPAAESLVTEGLTIEGPLVNNLSLPMLK
ncbi:hypothetical protein [Streptomyces sp. NPDC056479]|uniref:hypothetical protein n=1 Tax=unclassified Streptomyces TaxID=2593676 RepID=UPI0036C2341F